MLSSHKDGRIVGFRFHDVHASSNVAGHNFTEQSFVSSCIFPQRKPFAIDDHVKDCFYAIHRYVCNYITVFHDCQPTAAETGTS